MNIRNTNMKNKRGQKHLSNTLAVKVYALFNFLFLFGAIFAIINYRISMNQKISQLDRENINIKSEIHLLEREIGNLKIRREKLTSWPHISAKISEFALELRAPTPYQVSKMNVLNDEEFNLLKNDKVALTQR